MPDPRLWVLRRTPNFESQPPNKGESMTIDQATDLVRESLKLMLLLSAPVLAAALVIGLLVSIVQAVTQIQEQTLAIIPKMGAIIGVMAALFPWMLAQATNYMGGVFANFPRYLGG